jgi:hypothetical protein
MNNTVDGSAAEFDRCGLHTRCRAVFVQDEQHRLFIGADQRVSVKPFPVAEQSSQRLRDLPVLVPFIPGRERPGIEQNVSSQLDKLRLAVERRAARMVECSSNRRQGSHLFSIRSRRVMPASGSVLPSLPDLCSILITSWNLIEVANATFQRSCDSVAIISGAIAAPPVVMTTSGN